MEKDQDNQLTLAIVLLIVAIGMAIYNMFI